MHTTLIKPKGVSLYTYSTYIINYISGMYKNLA